MGYIGNELIWIDEALTPDSSRFWPADQYEPGKAQPSFDKQYVRDYLERIGWNKQPPGPALPDDVVTATRESTGKPISASPAIRSIRIRTIPHRLRIRARSTHVKDQLESLVGMMVERGILLEEAVTEFEKKFIKRVLERLNGNQSRAAKILGIHRNTLSRKVGEYKLDHVRRRGA